MAFDFNLYSTPLLFGFVQGWIYALIFWIRAWKAERLSDLLFGCLLIACTFEIWEYMLGFAGIEILWTTLEFLPRNFSFLLPPLAYLYLKSQCNTDFRLQLKHLAHAIPFAVYISYHILIFSLGPQFVEDWKQQVHHRFGIGILEQVLLLSIQIWYFILALRLYKHFHTWLPSEFSNVHVISFTWFRNFLVVFLISSIFGWSMTLIDLWLNLDFWHDWWDELVNVCLIYYLSIVGYAQTQPRKISYSAPVNQVTESAQTIEMSEEELNRFKIRIEELMEHDKPYLLADLTLAEMSRRLNMPRSIVSTAINQVFHKNFNDFINTYRVEAVKAAMKNPEMQHLSLLGIAMECGFNSKSTFNRAFRKATGLAPSSFKKDNPLR